MTNTKYSESDEALRINAQFWVLHIFLEKKKFQCSSFWWGMRRWLHLLNHRVPMRKWRLRSMKGCSDLAVLGSFGGEWKVTEVKTTETLLRLSIGSKSMGKRNLIPNLQRNTSSSIPPSWCPNPKPLFVNECKTQEILVPSPITS